MTVQMRYVPYLLYVLKLNVASIAVVFCHCHLSMVIVVQLFLEQKKIFKTGLNISRFRNHIPMIVDETEEYFQRWGDSGKRGMCMRVHNQRNNQL